MSTTIGPCFAFYVRHADEVEHLIELHDGGKLKETEDLTLFNEVLARADLEAHRLVSQCLDAGIRAVASNEGGVDFQKGSDRKYEMENWDAYRAFSHTAHSVEGTTPSLGVALLPAQDEVWLAPYFRLKGISDDQTAELGRRLRGRCPTIHATPPWWMKDGYPETVPLRIQPVSDDALFGDLVSICCEAFEDVGPHLGLALEKAPQAE